MPLQSKHARRVKARVKMGEHFEECGRNTKARRADVLFLGISFPSRAAIGYAVYTSQWMLVKRRIGDSAAALPELVL
jgi:hypothetical protein